MVKPLQNVRIVDLSRDYAGALCAKHLGDLGADVIRFEAGVKTFAHRQKTQLSASEAERNTLMSLADVIIDDRPNHDDDEPEVSAHTIYCHMPAFAPTHQYAHMAPVDGLLESYAGLNEVPLGRKPFAHSLSLISVTSAAYAACGVVAALIARKRDGRGQRVSLAQHDVAYTLLELNAMFMLKPPKTWATLEWASSPFVAGYDTKDHRKVYIHVGLDRHIKTFAEALKRISPEEAEALCKHTRGAVENDPMQVQGVARSQRIRKTIQSAFLKEDALTIEKVFKEAGLCVVAVRSLDEWLSSEFAQDSKIIDDKSKLTPCVDVSESPPKHDDQKARSIEGLIKAWTLPKQDLKPAQNLAPLAGIRVLDFTQVIAGPLCARVLAELGAEVLHIQNPDFKGPWVEAFHLAFNAGKENTLIDFKDPESVATFNAKVEAFAPDVVVQNFRRGVAERLGIGATRWQKSGAIFAALNAYGHEGALADAPGWEQTAQALCGIQEAFGGSQAQADLFPLPLNDVSTGLHGALGILAALYSEKQAQQVTTSLAKAATYMQARVAFDGITGEKGQGVGIQALSRFYKSKDGWLKLIASDHAALVDFFQLELADDFSAAEVGDALAKVIKGRKSEDWVEALKHTETHALHLIPRRSASAVLKDPRAKNAGLVLQREHHNLGMLCETTSALKLSRTPSVELKKAQPLKSVERMTTLAWAFRQGRAALTLVRSRLK